MHPVSGDARHSDHVLERQVRHAAAYWNPPCCRSWHVRPLGVYLRPPRGRPNVPRVKFLTLSHFSPLGLHLAAARAREGGAAGAAPARGYDTGFNSSRSVPKSRNARLSRQAQWSKVPGGVGLLAKARQARSYCVSVVVECRTRGRCAFT